MRFAKGRGGGGDVDDDDYLESRRSRAVEHE